MPLQPISIFFFFYLPTLYLLHGPAPAPAPPWRHGRSVARLRAGHTSARARAGRCGTSARSPAAFAAAARASDGLELGRRAASGSASSSAGPRRAALVAMAGRTGGRAARVASGADGRRRLAPFLSILDGWRASSLLEAPRPPSQRRNLDALMRRLFAWPLAPWSHRRPPISGETLPRPTPAPSSPCSGAPGAPLPRARRP